MYSEVTAVIFVKAEELLHFPPDAVDNDTPPSSQAQISGAEAAFTKTIVFPVKSDAEPLDIDTFTVLVSPAITVISFLIFSVPFLS